MAKFISGRAVTVTFGVLALTLAGGGIAAAQTTAAKPAAQTGQPGARPAAPAGQPALTPAEAAEAKAALQEGASPSFVAGSTSFAVVSAAGALVRGRDSVSATRYGPGQYQVVFNHSLVRGGYVANIGDAADCCIPPTGQVSVAPRLGTPNGVFVQTFDSTGAAADRPFHLSVFTP
ncbi:hypothetical protein OOK41_27375 [Micromonospora sp. NBC_01655]|uniref:hypothetical protein n=1 Tax=Micromonospora sp. NBC_01655 TaxID=2975983 RepID=UPI00225918F7|nr:hypothetical protein [Micromonospora sp. NBC_01655]MCX4473983.1 hypothetical protein [Micromonospora sp. NBC_01655]